MKNHSWKGFTLIELMVVIAIIGLLSSVILASVNNSRDKSTNAAIKTSLISARARIELLYTGKNYTATLCPPGYASDIVTGGDPNYREIITKINSLNGTTVYCLSLPSSWVIEAKLKVPEGTKNYWCVDYTGASVGKVNGASGSPASCSAII